MIPYIFTPANIRLSFENAKRFLEYFFEGGTRISRISRILFSCKQQRFSFGLNRKKLRRSKRSVRSVGSVWENSTLLTLLSRILSRTFRSSPYSHLPSGRNRRDRTCDTPLPCCQDSPLSASPGLWCSDASSAKNEAGSRTGYYWHNPLRHA